MSRRGTVASTSTPLSGKFAGSFSAMTPRVMRNSSRSRRRSRRTASTRPAATRHSSPSAPTATRSTRNGIDSCADLRSGAMPSIAMPTRSLSTLNSGDGFSVSVAVYRACPCERSSNCCTGVTLTARRSPATVAMPVALKTASPSGRVLASILVCPPRADAVKLVLCTPASEKLSAPMTRENSGASVSCTSLFAKCNAPVTLLSAACPNGMPSFSSSLALPLASAFSVTAPIQRETGLVFT